MTLPPDRSPQRPASRPRCNSRVPWTGSLTLGP